MKAWTKGLLIAAGCTAVTTFYIAIGLSVYHWHERLYPGPPPPGNTSELMGIMWPVGLSACLATELVNALEGK